MTDKKKEETVAEVKEEVSDFHKFAALAEEARAGRDLSSIPLNDKYWALAESSRQSLNK